MSDFTNALNDALVYADIPDTLYNMSLLASKITPDLRQEAEEWGWSDTEVFAQLYRLAEKIFDEYPTSI